MGSPLASRKTALKKRGAFSARALTCYIFFGGIIFADIARASPADYIYMPAVEYGEREIDFKYGEASPQPGSPSQTGTPSAQGISISISIGLGYGAQEHWFTEVYLKQERIGNQNANMAEWENKFQLTETGQYPVDLGFVTELEAPLNGNAPWEINIGPLLQTEFDKLQLNGNVLFGRAFGKPDEHGVPYVINLGYQWQAKYRWQPALEYGLQGIGGMGKWNNWNNQASQTHILGPMIAGKFHLGNRQAIQYNAAWLVGASKAAPNHTFRMQVEYEF